MVQVDSERELKFKAQIGDSLPDLRPLVGRVVRQPEQRLNTAYFDSVDTRLWARGLTLRHRTTGEQDEGVWTLKTPISEVPWLERHESSWPGGRDLVPPQAEAFLRGVLRREPLRHLVELDTVRRRFALHGDQGEILAELDDDLVSVSAGPNDGMRFRQVELELQNDRDWSPRPVVERLQKEGVSVESTSKLARAMDLPSPSRVLHRLNEASSLADVLHMVLCEGFVALVDNDWRLRIALPDFQPHEIHMARVATRRLRSNLKTYKDVLDPVWLGHVRQDLKLLGSALGEVRDVDVLMADTAGLADNFKDVKDALAEQRKTACDRLTDFLVGERHLRLLDRLHAASMNLPLGGGRAAETAATCASEVVPDLVGARWRTLRRRARKAKRHLSPERLHRVRISARHLRFAAEAVSPVIGRPARRVAKASKKVQSELGDHHDAVVTEEWLRDRAREEDGSTAFEAGVVAARTRRGREGLERRWQRASKSLTSPKGHRWLQGLE